MNKTIEDFKKAAKGKNITRWTIHHCSMCGYPCGYCINGDEVLYDSGCSCSMQPPRKSSWEDLIDHYNRNQRENNKNISQEALDKMDSFWGF